MNQADDSLVIDIVENAIGIFPVVQNAFVPEYGQVLGNVALAGPNLLDDTLYADGLVAQNTQYFEPDRVRHRLQAFCSPVDVRIVVMNQMVIVFHV